MNKAIFWISITLVFIGYYIFLYTESDKCEYKKYKNPRLPELGEISQDCFYMKYSKFFVCVDPVSESLYLSSNPEEAEKFCIVNVFKNRNAIKSSSLDKWITIDYQNDQMTKKYIEFKSSKLISKDNSIKIKIIKKRNKYVLKFFSGDLLCLDKTSGNFYSSRHDKWNIFYFTIVN